MDSANLPSQTDLNSLYGAWNPMAYIQGQQNQDLAAQFRDQAYKANQNTVTEGALKNDQASQMNPLLLAQQGLTNTGLDLTNQGTGIKNASSGIDLAQKSALAPDDLAAKREDLHNQLGDAQYTALTNQILKSHLANLQSGDPTKIAQTAPMLDFLAGPVGSKVSQAVRDRQLGNERIQAGITEAGIGANATTNAAGIHVGGQIGAANIAEAAKIRAAEIGQKLQSGLTEEMNKPKEQQDPDKIKTMLQAMQLTQNGFGGLIDTRQFGFDREANTTGGGAPALSAADQALINKHLKK